MVYYLPSVKCLIDTNDLYLYAQEKKGNFIKWKHLDEMSDSFFMRLNDSDFGTIENLLNNR
jgi:hypothetical protein